MLSSSKKAPHQVYDGMFRQNAANIVPATTSGASPPHHHKEATKTSATLVKQIQGILNCEASDLKQIYISRQVDRLVGCWGSFTGGLLCFENDGCLFARLPLDAVVELLSFLPLFQIHKLCTVSKMFAFPQVYMTLCY
jgi:hypothetical protein